MLNLRVGRLNEKYRRMDAFVRGAEHIAPVNEDPDLVVVRVRAWFDLKYQSGIAAILASSARTCNDQVLPDPVAYRVHARRPEVDLARH
jgi:hypothetical protein